MTYATFKRELNQFFKQYGFTQHGSHFYLDMGNDILIVFGVQKSDYDEYCYMSYGYCFKSICKYLPFPKFNELNLNFGRLMPNNSQIISYATMSNEEVSEMLCGIRSIVLEAIVLAKEGAEEIKRCCFIEKERKFSYVLGKVTVDYFHMDVKDFQYHICFD